MISEHSSRREALKSILAVTGGLAAAAFLPARWVKPVVNTGTIPAHAQASAVQVGKITIYHDEPQTDGVTYFTVPAFQVFAQTPGFSCLLYTSDAADE